MSADALILIHFSKRRDEGKEKKGPRRAIGAFYADVKVHSSGEQLSGERERENFIFFFFFFVFFFFPLHNTGVMRR